MMSKYKVGDKFIATITKLNNSGMGTLIELNDCIFADISSVQRLEPCENVANSPIETVSESKPKEYTLEELNERILVISDLLAKTVEAYRQAKRNLKNGIDTVDAEVERLSE